MGRFKDVHWNCGNGEKVQSVEHAQLAVLMDIRDELKELNATLSCYRVARMSDDVHRIYRRLRAAGFLVSGRTPR